MPAQNNAWQIERQTLFIGGVNDSVPATYLGPTQCALLKNAEVYSHGTIRRRPGLQVQKSLATGLTGDARPFLLGRFHGRGHTPALVAAVNDTPTTAKVYIDDGFTGTLSYAAPWLFNESVNLCQVLDRLYVLQPGFAPHFWKWGQASLKPDDGEMPYVGSVLYFRGRAWAGGDPSNPRLLYFSQGINASDSTGEATVGRFEWDAENLAFLMQTGKIVAILPHQDFGIVVLTDRGMEIMEVDPCDVLNSVRNTISTSNGCAAPHSAQRIGEDLLFVDTSSHVYSVAQTIANEAKGITNVPLSLPIRDTIARVNKDRLHTIRSAVFDGQYLVAFPTGTSLYPNELWLYSMRDQSWTGPYPLHYDPDAASPTLDPYLVYGLHSNKFFTTQAERLFVLSKDANGAAKTYRLTGKTDDSVTVPVEVQTRGYEFQAPHTRKAWNNVEVELRFIDSPGDVAVDVTVQCRVDEGAWRSVGTMTFSPDAGPALPATLPFTLTPYARQTKKLSLVGTPDGYSLQVRLRVSDSTCTWEILGIQVSAQLQTNDFAV